MELHWLLYAAAFGLIVIGIIGVVTLSNIFRIVLALVIAEAGANLLLVIAGYRFDAIAPILSGSSVATGVMVDPVPQAMVLTSIVIGVGIQALALALVIKVYQHYKTLDLREIHQRLMNDIDQESGVRPLLSPHKPAGKRPLPEPQTVTGYHDIARGGNE
ncbi:MAG: cation:proton antiporter subunit C [Gammaproteobacteria bacterium]|nr:cation:proton antiporter subunit C [Gammaproteobacteria bacterium]MBL7000484.1 cation:proton antiporter subunit C [Gammaproteobacteria bacterium]